MAQRSRIHLQCKKLRFDPWVGKIPWIRAWQPTLVFLSRESRRQRNLAGCSLKVVNSWTQLRLTAHGAEEEAFSLDLA